MTFATLSSYFEKLENTPSRLSLIEILSELFKEAKELEIATIIYLTQGRVGPFYEAIEIGMAEKNVAKSIGDTFGITKEEVLNEYKKKGDLGIVAYDLSRQMQHKNKKGDVLVQAVFDVLRSIAKTSGEGTVEKRVAALRELLEHMDPVSAKHLVRIPLGNSRLGIGDPTVLDGLATAKLGDKSNRKLLEKAYNETSDLGLIGKTLWSGGLEAVQKLSITVGRPIRSELCERLPNPVKVFEKMSPSSQSSSGQVLGVHATPKYDGFRVQIHKNGDKVSMFSRNLEDMTHMFPELIVGTLKQVKAKTAILDTEALAYQPESEEFLPFQETTKRRRKHNIEAVAKQLPLKAFVFDILYLDGKSLIDLPLMERMKILKENVKGDEILIPAYGKVLEKPQDLQLMLDDSISKGLEGVVVKKIDSPYQAGGRNFNWVKLKRHSSGELNDTIDCVVLGYIYGKGKRTEFGAGALLVGVYDKKNDEFVTVSKIGTGLTDDEWREIKTKSEKLKVTNKPARVNSLIIPSVWVEPKIVIEVLADEITRSPLHTAGMANSPTSLVVSHNNANDQKLKTNDQVGYALRFPRLVSFRSLDKIAEDATSVEELIEMFNNQGKK